uniref:Uncharacterized protein LOC114338802 n=1 Tax=Diabrotica virgifera virgifera TaxID=50390 RepID=A0A6P7GH28_DIAVI
MAIWKQVLASIFLLWWKLIYLLTCDNFLFFKIYLCPFYCSRRDPIRPVINKFEEPITSAFTKFLTIDAEVKSPIEDGDEYYEKVKQIKSKKIQELHLKDPIDHAIVKEDKMMGMATEYQVEYRSLGK